MQTEAPLNGPIDFSAELDCQQLLAGQNESDLSCLVKIVPNGITQTQLEHTAAASICLVFDCSFSMLGKNFSSAIETAKMIVDMLHSRHRLSLVAFNSSSHIVFQDAVPAEAQKDQIKSMIDGIQSYLGGTTNMAAGIDNAMDILSQSDCDAKVILLLSDGTPDSAKDAQESANKASFNGAQLYAVGMGRFYQAEQLLRLVTPSNGAVFGDSDEDKIADIFRHIIHRVDRIFATDVRLRFNFNDSVRVKQLIKTSPERALYNANNQNSDHQLDIRIGNIEDNKRYEFLLHLEVGCLDAGSVELLSAQLQYHYQSIITEEVKLSVEFTKLELVEKERNDELENAMRSASVVQLSEILVNVCAKSEFERALEITEQLQQQCSQQEYAILEKHLDKIKYQVRNQLRVDDKILNDFLLASSKAPDNLIPSVSDEPPLVVDEATEDKGEEVKEDCEEKKSDSPDKPEIAETVAEQEPQLPIVDGSPIVEDQLGGPELFDIALIDPGDQLILLARIIRGATSMGMRDIANSITTKNSVIATSFKDKDAAEKFQKQLKRIGAKSSIQSRQLVEEA